ncbi:hypothetical protein BD410DRAFT_434290 [Rickenella mellea]|uniref:Aminoglycoside phosphotransferase domain-containing protein n=1 Tax=Rickenella mellea TaxID=50990 RepID=A0A4Y7PWW5_9AGAM|nr:hypothetical protein BD410DRAFT_434290 [Rickenella mellea]
MADSSPSIPDALDINIIIDNRQAGMPSPKEILSLCHAANSVGFPFPSSDQPVAWIKFGRWVTKGEALTQHSVALAMNAISSTAVHVPAVYLAFMADGRGYIVMEFVPGLTVAQRLSEPGADAKNMYQAVGRAVQQLIAHRAPTGTTQPGPVGGGCIRHDFFPDRESAIAYPTVGVLQEHVNRILKLSGCSQRVNFTDEVATNGLPLCPGDIHETNWIIDDEGRVHALDFEHYNFLPPSFVAYALEHWYPFSRRVAKYVDYRRSESNVYAMSIAAGQLLVSGHSVHGLPKSLRPLT